MSWTDLNVQLLPGFSALAPAFDVALRDQVLAFSKHAFMLSLGAPEPTPAERASLSTCAAMARQQ